jgi:glutamate racemase
MSSLPRGRRPIAIFDSGVGGLPYLAEARAALPAESFVYLADRAGFPYGTKPREEVREMVLRLVARLVEAWSPRAVLVACNTASQAALEALRRANPGLPIVGTVPAVKPAAERSRTGVIGVMATAGAVEDPYLDALIARHAKGVRVLREGAQELVSFVERRSVLAGEEERREAVAPHVRRLVDGGADEIVLACTHFLHLRDDIAAAAGPGVEVVDSRAGVVRRLRQLLSERGLLAGAERGKSAAGPRGLFLLTGDEPFEAEYGLFARSFDLDGPEPLAWR